MDGFKIAAQLREAYPEAFDVLTRVAIPFRVIDSKASHYFKVPTICVDEQGRLVEVHFNDRTRAPLEVCASTARRPPSPGAGGVPHLPRRAGARGRCASRVRRAAEVQ